MSDLYYRTDENIRHETQDLQLARRCDDLNRQRGLASPPAPGRFAQASNNSSSNNPMVFNPQSLRNARIECLLREMARRKHEKAEGEAFEQRRAERAQKKAAAAVAAAAALALSKKKEEEDVGMRVMRKHLDDDKNKLASTPMDKIIDHNPHHYFQRSHGPRPLSWHPGERLPSLESFPCPPLQPPRRQPQYRQHQQCHGHDGERRN